MDQHNPLEKTANENTKPCLNSLKKRGYNLVALTLSPTAIPLNEVELDKPTALCIGTEMQGLSRNRSRLSRHTRLHPHARIHPKL